tara:strand:+ start:692 stop:1117 length:426 start_codon:yes stop_codon:yes gene_type:complete
MKIGQLNEAISLFQAIIESQGMVVNERDAEHLKHLIEVRAKAYGYKRYARQCSITEEGMNEGWIDEQTDEYFKNKSDVVKHIKELMDEEVANGGVPFVNWKSKKNDDILEIGYNFFNIYWTEWECTEDYQYEEINGVLTEI